MADNVINSPFDNDFVEAHCTDNLHKQIISELSTRKPGEKTGKKINLLPETLRAFLYYVSVGNTLGVSARLAGINEKTRANWSSISDTFREVTSLAQENLVKAALEVQYKAMVGTKPGFYKLENPGTKEVKYIEIHGKEPNPQIAQWILEKKRYFGAEDTGQPQLGAPRNEEEAQLLERLLNKHYDYVKAKESAK